MPKKILINTRTSGKVKQITIDGRPHLSTLMMPIRGNTTMNDLFYPDDQVTASYNQLEMLPAPNGHPKVNGINTSAFHPVANNKHNVGGFLRNVRKKGERVFCDFCLDLQVANSTDAGKSLVSRMNDGGKIGVSTGLTIANVTNESGVDDLGVSFSKKGSGFKFDHVAILLNEVAAGDHAGTELILNENDEQIEVVNLAIDETTQPAESNIENMSDKDLRSLLVAINEQLSTKENQTQLNTKDPIMDKKALALAIVTNTASGFGVGDLAALEAMTDGQLAAIISKNPLTVENAKATLTASGFDFSAYENFTTNAADFNAYQVAQKSELDTLRAGITALNAAMTPEMLAGKSKEELLVLNEMAGGKKQAKRIPEGAHMQTNNAEKDLKVTY